MILKRNWLLLGLCVAAALVGAVYLGFTESGLWSPTPSAEAQPSAADSDRAPAFSLTNSRGVAVTERSVRGDWHVVYFGFAGCSSTCPTALHSLSAALDAMGHAGADVRVVFITIDPNDSPAALNDFLRPYGPRFSGLTGSQEQLNAVEQTFRVYAERVASAAPGAAFLHSSEFYVLDPAGHIRKQISTGSNISDLTASLRSAIGTDSE